MTSGRRCFTSPRTAAIVVGTLVLLLTSAFAPRARAGDDTPGEMTPSQPLVEGKPLFEAKGCARCHSIWGGHGGKQAGPDLGRTGSWHDIMQFAGALWNHTPTLTGQRSAFSSDEMGKLAAYLFFVKFVGEPGSVEKGKDLFEQRSCSGCHQLAGRGGMVGPRLDELKPYMSSFFMAQALWNHGPQMAAKMADLNIVRPRLEDNDVANLVALIRGDAPSAAPLELAYAQAGNPRMGKALFQEKGCIKCHTIGGTGGTVGPDLGKPRPQVHMSQMVGGLWNHGPTMWAKMKDLGVPFPRLTDTEISDLLAYLYFVQYMGQSGDAARGADLFREKSCFGCHAAGGEGSKVGPDLATAVAVRSPLDWVSAMWNHTPAMENKFRQAQSAWPRFDDDQMRDLVEFLRSRGQGK
ncbi:MAG: c-type cytochrome [Candidatus Binatia bacterium]